MKKSIFISVFIGFMAILLSVCSKNHNNLMINNGVFTVGININYPPMEYYDFDGISPIGFDIELAKAIAHDMKLDVEFADTAWDAVFDSLNEKKIDCIISSVTITQDRRNKYEFSVPYIENALVLVMPKNFKHSVKSPSDLNGLSVAYQEQTTADDYLSALAAKGLDFTAYQYGKMTQCFDDLQLGRADAVLTDLVVAHHYLADSGGNLSGDKFEIVWQGEEEVFGICFKKGDTALANRINKTLEKLFLDGTILSISKEFFNGKDLVTAALR